MSSILKIEATVQKVITGTADRQDRTTSNYDYVISCSAEVGVPQQQVTIAGSGTFLFDLTQVPQLKGVVIKVFGETPKVDLYLAVAGTKIPIKDFFAMTFSENPARLEIRNPGLTPVSLDLWAMGATS